MRLARLFLPVLLALALLSAQLGAAAHQLGHAFGQVGHQDKQAPHSPACEQCAAYAQIGSALHVSAFSLVAAAAPAGAVPHRPAFFRSIHGPAATARGPPPSSLV